MTRAAQFIVCPRRGGTPRVAVKVCRTCARRAKCPAWYEYVNPSLFPEAPRRR